ncbi:MAG: hypothetical protein AMXMBFR46_10650 [Acidimicrobiia bacterium]
MADFLLPVDDDPLTKPFWDGCARGELLMQRFRATGRCYWPPRPMEPESRTLEYDWVPVSGRGTVWSLTIPHPPLLPAYSELAPYNVIIVELEEDPRLRLVGNLVESAEAPLDSIDPHSIEIGDPVAVVFAPVGDMFLPRWVRR